MKQKFEPRKKKQILDLTMKVFEEEYNNPNYKEREIEKVNIADMEGPPYFAHRIEAPILKKTSFVIEGTIDGMNLPVERIAQYLTNQFNGPDMQYGG